MRARINSVRHEIGKFAGIVAKGFPLRLYLCDVDPARMPASTVFPHPIGIVIARHTNIGEDVWIYQNVTLGTKPGRSQGPTIGDGVVIYGAAMVIGPVEVGPGAVIGAGAQIFRDVAPGEVVTSHR